MRKQIIGWPPCDILLTGCSLCCAAPLLQSAVPMSLSAAFALRVRAPMHVALSWRIARSGGGCAAVSPFAVALLRRWVSPSSSLCSGGCDVQRSAFHSRGAATNAYSWAAAAVRDPPAPHVAAGQWMAASASGGHGASGGGGSGSGGSDGGGSGAAGSAAGAVAGASKRPPSRALDLGDVFGGSHTAAGGPFGRLGPSAWAGDDASAASDAEGGLSDSEADLDIDGAETGVGVDELTGDTADPARMSYEHKMAAHNATVAAERVGGTRVSEHERRAAPIVGHNPPAVDHAEARAAELLVASQGVDPKLVTEQLNDEMRCRSVSCNDAQRIFNRMEAIGRGSTIPAVRLLLEEWFGTDSPLLRKLRAIHTLLRAGKAKGTGHRIWGPALLEAGVELPLTIAVTTLANRLLACTTLVLRHPSSRPIACVVWGG
jgi:hypothetical protein